MTRTITNPPGLHDPSAYGYSHTVAVRASELVFVAGQYGADSSGTVVSTGFADQVARSFDNLAVALAAVGLDLGHVVSLGLHVVDHDADRLVIVLDQLQASWKADPPAATLRGVAALALPDMLFEVDAIAARP